MKEPVLSRDISSPLLVCMAVGYLTKYRKAVKTTMPGQKNTQDASTSDIESDDGDVDDIVDSDEPGETSDRPKIRKRKGGQFQQANVSNKKGKQSSKAGRDTVVEKSTQPVLLWPFAKEILQGLIVVQPSKTQ